MRPLARIVILSCLVLSGIAAATFAQRPATPPAAPGTAPRDLTARITAAAQAVLDTLDPADRAKMQFPFDSPQKTRWSNFPSPMFQRTGLRLADVTPAQRARVMTLLSVALSRDGYRKVTEIMQGDEVLRTNDPGPPGGRGGRGGDSRGSGRGAPDSPGPPGGRGPEFGRDQYYLAFVGMPSVTAPWMLQFGGHHLAINLTLAGSEATMAPSLPAAQPATYTFEGQTVRPLGRENDKAFGLINALEAGQRSQAILGYRVADLVLGPGQDGRSIQPEGIRASALSASQQAMLWDLVREWSGIMSDAFAEPRMSELRGNLNDTYFAWSGPTTNGSAAYFRIQGPSLVIEYAPQDSVNHIHTIYRDPTNDYGAKFARR
jgi:hypothetical protein